MKKFLLINLLIIQMALSAFESSFFDTCGWGKFTVGGDWLYWKVEETRLDYGAAVTLSDVDDTTTISSQILKPKFKYSDGFRVYGNYTTADDLWNVCLAYTSVPTKASNSFIENSMVSVDFATLFSANFPLLTAISEAQYSELNSVWKADIDYLDFDISRKFSPCENFEITPHIGVRALWYKQKFDLMGLGDDIIFGSELKGHICAAGLEGGLKAVWQFYDGFALVGHIGGSLMYAKYKNSGELAVVGDDAIILIDYKENDRRTLPMFDSFVGITYTTCVWDYSVSAYAGWENHLIYDTNEFSVTGSGNSSMQGLTLGANVTF